MNQGVPQGSILGPLLFIVYMNDIHDAVNNELVLFADDTTTICRSKTQEMLTVDIERTLFGLNEWFGSNSLKMNIEKTQLMCFKYKLDKLQLASMPTPLSQSETVRFLGLYMDDNFKFQTHIDHLVKKLSRLIYVLFRLRDFVPTETLLQVYYGYIHSNIRFGLLFWGNSSHVDKILRVQKRAVRIIAGAQLREPCRPLFRNLKILTTIDLFVLECAMFVKKNFGLFDDYHFEHTYQTRNRDQLVVLQTAKSYINNGVLNTCIRVYNAIPKELRLLDNVNKFRVQLKKTLITKAHYKLEEFLV